MSRDNQIEEMANDYYEAMLKARETLGSMNEGEPKWYAKELYAKGYRKSTDVAREIIDILREIQNDLQARDEFREASAIRFAIGQVEYYAEKKYESEGNEHEI